MKSAATIAVPANHNNNNQTQQHHAKLPNILRIDNENEPLSNIDHLDFEKRSNKTNNNDDTKYLVDKLVKLQPIQETQQI